MKRLLLTFMVGTALVACAPTEDEKAQPTLDNIEKLYAEGKYAATLDSITSLRERFPMAVEARKKALKIWQDASLKMAQKDVAETDIKLQEAIRMAENETDRLKRALLGAKRDSLQARYEAMCGVVRMIRMRQKQQ